MANRPARTPLTFTGWREQAVRAIVAAVVVIVILMLLWAAAAAGVLVSVPLIWMAERIGQLWRWWAHVWGILGY